MGGKDKGLVQLAGRPMIAYVLDRLAPQASTLFINANRNLDIYETMGHTVVRDEFDNYQGPLAGILSALNHCPTPYLLCAPCDVPALPTDLASRLGTALQQQQGRLAVVHDGNKLQPAFALIPTQLQGHLRDYMQHGKRRLRAWVGTHRLALADYSDQPRAFTNINDEEALRNFQEDGRLGPLSLSVCPAGP